jgi:anti-sigma-K factor RskA
VSVDDQPVAPPERVWHRILADVRQPNPLAAEPDKGTDFDQTERDHGSVSELTVTPVSHLRRKLRPGVLAVAAGLVGLLVGTGATLALTRDRPAPTASAAQIVLQPLDALAAAVLDLGAGNQRTLTVHVQGLPAVPGTFYEAWLMNAEPQRLLSLGVLDSTHAGVFQIPPGLDLSRYPVVDISLQPFNGSPAHSGDSAVRGTIPA